MGNNLKTEIRIADDRNFYVIEARFPLQDHQHIEVKVHSHWMEFYGEYDSVKISLSRKGVTTHSSCSPSTPNDDGSFTRNRRTPETSNDETWITPKRINKKSFDLSHKPSVDATHGKIRICVNKVKKKSLQKVR